MGKFGIVTTCDIPPSSRATTEIFDVDRFHVVSAFAALPEEVFRFFLGQMMHSSETSGGFERESGAAVEALGTSCSNYFAVRP